jgi:hypothetical protein
MGIPRRVFPLLEAPGWEGSLAGPASAAIGSPCRLVLRMPECVVGARPYRRRVDKAHCQSRKIEVVPAASQPIAETVPRATAAQDCVGINLVDVHLASSHWRKCLQSAQLQVVSEGLSDCFTDVRLPAKVAHCPPA